MALIQLHAYREILQNAGKKILHMIQNYERINIAPSIAHMLLFSFIERQLLYKQTDMYLGP